MDLREQIKGLLDKSVSGKQIESLTDSIMNLVVQTDPNLSDATFLLRTIESLKQELLDVSQKVLNLEDHWNKLQSALLPTPATAPTPTVVLSTPTVTPPSTPKLQASSGSYLTNEELAFFRDKCVVEKDDTQKIVTSVKEKTRPSPYTPDGASFRIVVVEGGKQKRFNRKKLYEALYEDDFPQR